MPLYDYSCSACGSFQEMRSIASRNEPAKCPDCEGQAQRLEVFSIRHSFMSGEDLKAHETNERSRYEPKLYSHQCSAGCSHGTTGKGKAGKQTAAQSAITAKSFPRSRPWMISH